MKVANTTCIAKTVVASQPCLVVSYVTSTDTKDVKLHAFRSYDKQRKFKMCDGDGRVFKTQQECKEFALERGYLMEYFPKK